LASIACFSNIPDELLLQYVYKLNDVAFKNKTFENYVKNNESFSDILYCTAGEKKVGTKCNGTFSTHCKSIVPFMMRLFSAGKLLKLITIPNVSQQCCRD
jgi:hypothetical protein